MSDIQSAPRTVTIDGAAVPAETILVNRDPLKDNAESSLRVLIMMVGVILAAFGVTKYAGTLSIMAGQAGNIVAAIGAVVALVTYLVGQAKTYALSNKASTMAKILPNSIAQTK